METLRDHNSRHTSTATKVPYKIRDRVIPANEFEAQPELYD
jgi:hypothetical protein